MCHLGARIHFQELEVGDEKLHSRDLRNKHVPVSDLTGHRLPDPVTYIRRA